MASERRLEEMQKTTSFMIDLVRAASWGSRAPAIVAEMEVEGQESGAVKDERLARLARLVDAMGEDLRAVRGARVSEGRGEREWEWV
jgi:hypothetical protein